jgi:signal transduction histidine kinase
MSVSAEILEHREAGRAAPGRLGSTLDGWRRLASLRPPVPWHVTFVLAGSLAITVLASQLERGASEQAARARFGSRSAEIIRAIHGRMAAYEEVLRGGLGLFVATGDVTRAAWRSYVDALRIEQNFPGIQGLGYSLWLRPGDKDAYIARIRAEGFPEFAIHPDSGSAEATSITYLEPFDQRNRQAFGYDMWSEPVRRAAMQAARDRGRATISGRVTPVQETDRNVQAGFLMYLPYYGRQAAPETVAERRAALVGFVYSPLRMGDLMAGIAGDLGDVRLEIHDGDAIGPGSLMYDSAAGDAMGSPAPPARFETAAALDIDGHVWTARFTSLPVFEAMVADQRPAMILIAGALISILLAGAVLSIGHGHARAAALARERDRRASELAKSNAEFEQFVLVAAHDLKAPLQAIDNLAGWIEEDLGQRLAGEARDNIDLLRARVHRLEALLTDLLQYARVGRAEIETETVDSGQLVCDLFDLHNVERGFSLAVSSHMPRLETARSALEQVFGHLLSNAIRHHDRPCGQVTVGVRDVGCCYRFSVTDDGPGIPPQDHERVFQAFQTHRPRDDVEGSGMGLAIVRKLLEQQGATITLESDGISRGATFRFDWPKRWRQAASPGR